MDQTLQRHAHHLVKIGSGEAVTMELQLGDELISRRKGIGPAAPRRRAQRDVTMILVCFRRLRVGELCNCNDLMWNLRPARGMYISRKARRSTKHGLKLVNVLSGGNSLALSETIVRDVVESSAYQFFCTRQLPPAALRFEHNFVA